MHQVDDSDRFAHIEHEDLTAAAEDGRLEHQLHRLGDRHEVAAHVGVGDGDRAASGDLLAEDWHGAAAAA